MMLQETEKWNKLTFTHFCLYSSSKMMSAALGFSAAGVPQILPSLHPLTGQPWFLTGITAYMNILQRIYMPLGSPDPETSAEELALDLLDERLRGKPALDTSCRASAKLARLPPSGK